MKLRKILIATLFIIFMIFQMAGICWAEVGITWSGSLEVGDTYQAASPPNPQDTTTLNSSFDLKMDINDGEKQSGTVLLKYKYQSQNQNQNQDTGSLSIYQAYLDMLLSENSVLRMGRQKISWGSGFAWNSTNYIGAAKNRSDLVATNPGVDAIDYEVTRGDSSVVLALKPQSTWSTWSRAVKFSWQVWHSDISLSAFQHEDDNAFGIDYATAIGNYTCYIEIASKTGTQWYIANDNSEKQRANSERYFHGVLGVNGNLNKNWMLLLEYYYNQEGWNDMEAANWSSLSPGLQGPLSEEKGNLFGELRRNYLNMMVRKGEVI
jgi:hypothetical protein